MFEVKELSCIRDDRALFTGVSFALTPRSLLLIEGKNGCGKTSLLRILCGLRLPDAGGVAWDGQTIAEHGPAYHAQVAYLGHADGHKLDLTPLENLAFARALGNAKDHVDLEAVLDRMNLFGLEDVPTRVLSAGQKRRLALARLLVVTAPLWILDEPLSSLDRAGIDLVLELLREHLGSGGMAVMTTHHRVEMADVETQTLDLSAI